ncbi:MAG TPA: glycosyltransferase family 2 protein [bacterium]|nr:glycosyltransferase family 2 protein [bacterium]
MSDWRYRRIFEILPGLIAWFVLIFPVLLGVFSPKWFAIVMIFFISYWLVKTFVMSYRLVLGYRNYRRDRKTNWEKKLDSLSDWRRIYHLIIVPTYKEDISILRSSIKSVVESKFPKENIIYILATEERDKERAEEYSAMIKMEYGKKVGHFEAIMHPKDIPGEVVGKGGNITYAAKQFLPYFSKNNIAYENVIVTSMDSDHLLDPHYLADLTYKYVTDPDPIHKSFQPLPMFFNNIWDVPMVNRLIAMGSSFWQLIVTTRPSRLRNFSSHAQSLAALIKVDFWSTKTIVEDGHQFWRTYYGMDGCHEVVPMYTPIYQDAVLADDFLSTMKEQYLQKRRWSWGVSDIPFVMEHTFKDKNIPWFDRWANALILWDAHISWSTTSLILAISSWVPFVLNNNFSNDIVAFNFRTIYFGLLAIAWIGMIISLTISTLLAPPDKNKGRKPIGRILLDWILTPIILPVSNILFSSIPALESQTRLMTKRYLEVFRVTIKSPKRSNLSLPTTK